MKGGKMDNDYIALPKGSFEFVNSGTLSDEGLKTKSRSFFADALLRFRKNKSSVVSAFIILFLVLFAIFSPIISPYSVYDRYSKYQKKPPFAEGIAEMRLGILDGGVRRDSQSELQLTQLRAIASETAHDPVIKILGSEEVREIYRGEERLTKYYSLRVNSYFAIGVEELNISYEEYENIQRWQDENGIQVIYPWVEASDAYKNASDKPPQDFKIKSNVWYLCSDYKSSTPILDENGDFIPAYSTDRKISGSYPDGTPVEYTSKMRVKGDGGDYIYAKAASGSLKCRIEAYSYYKYLNDGRAPTFLFGTDEYGADLFCAIGMGARFSLLFALLVSAINLVIGAIYGAVQGYYGGITDLALDRLSDILSGVPFIVVATLFKLHLATRVGPVVSFLFAFVLTGWISTAALTRKQFYRFKGSEYVMAARTLGASDRRIMLKHIFPNAIGTMITSCALVIPGVISSEASLSYLGIVDLSEITGTSIGTLMASGQNSMAAAPHAMLFPALFMSLLLISFNLFGNGLRDAFNPSTKGEV